MKLQIVLAKVPGLLQLIFFNNECALTKIFPKNHPKTYPRNQTALLINYFAVRPNLTFRSYFVSQIKIRALSGTSGLQNPDWPQQLSNVKSSPRVVILTGCCSATAKETGPLRWAFQKASLLDPLHIFGDPGEKNTYRWKISLSFLN